MSNDAARELGRRGGQKRAENMTAEERSESARRAVTVRWEREEERQREELAERLRRARGHT